MKTRSFQSGHLIFLLALLRFILPFWIQNAVYEPHRDEFLYVAEGHHLAWGYLEVPPLMSVLAWVNNIMGGSLFWIKFWPSLFGSLTFVLVGKLILDQGGRWFALVLGFLPFVFGYYTHVFFMFQPNFLEVFFWTLMAYGLADYIRRGKPVGLYVAGIGFGLGMMSKYSVFFFALSLILGLLLTPERKIFLQKHFYLALATGLLIWLPNLIWQWSYGFPIVHHMKELRQQQLNNVDRLHFIRDQLMFNLPCIFIWLSGLYAVGVSKGYRFIGWAVLLVLTFLVVQQGKSYYGMGAYPVLFAFGAVYLEKNLRPSTRAALVCFALLFGCCINMVSLPFLPPAKLASFYASHKTVADLGFLQWEDQKDHPLPQDFADMLSWNEITAKTALVYQSLDSAERRQTIIEGGNYGEVGALNYYGPKYQLPEAMGPSANFLLWTPADFWMCANVILVTDYREEVHSDWVHEFRSAVLMDSVTNRYAREYGSYIILLKGPSQKARDMWRDYYGSLRRDLSVFQ